nr:MAG TPA: hypothetical protein [Caudoviricetes sp.]
MYVRIATINNATDTINCNSSYVLIRHPSLQDSGRVSRSRSTGCLGKYIIVNVLCLTVFFWISFFSEPKKNSLFPSSGKRKFH